MSGDALPFQLIYEGKTSRCLPSYSFPKGFDITCNPTQWSNETTMLRYLEKVVFSYVSQKREDLGMPADYPALLLFDNFSGQCYSWIIKDDLRPSHPRYLDSAKLHRQTATA